MGKKLLMSMISHHKVVIAISAGFLFTFAVLLTASGIIQITSPLILTYGGLRQIIGEKWFTLVLVGFGFGVLALIMVMLAKDSKDKKEDK